MLTNCAHVVETLPCGLLCSFTGNWTQH